MLLVYVSHRLHVDGAGEPALSSTEAHSTT
jgi:hypothetical protein